MYNKKYPIDRTQAVSFNQMVVFVSTANQNHFNFPMPIDYI